MSLKQVFTRFTHSPRSSIDEKRGGSPRRSNADIWSEKEHVYSSDDGTDEQDWESRNSKKKAKRKSMLGQVSRSSEDVEDEKTPEAELRKREQLEEAAKEETNEMKANYGELPMMQSTNRSGEKLTHFDAITEDMVGQEIVFRARIHNIRRMGARLVFLLFRQQTTTIQGVLHDKPHKISTVMVHWAEHLPLGSIVKVRATIREAAVPVKKTDFHTIELNIDAIHLIARREEHVPFTIYEADLVAPDEEEPEGIRRSHVPDRTRLANRIIDLRTQVGQAIFRLQSGIGKTFRAALDDKGFLEIHTPKLQGSATESGASVFKVNYFGRDAFLAQSPQLAKQMAIAADFERVYEVGAVFRAENSNTHRHLTEYTGLDIEMAIEEHYHEMMEIIDFTIKSVFKTLYVRYKKEIEVLKEQFPCSDLVWKEETPVIKFADAIKMLNESGWRQDNGEPLSETEDFGTRDEIRLGELVKEKFGTDYYIVDQFPAAARPFYTMPSPHDSRFTNSFDIFVRGQEIVTGGQRIHDAKMLEQRMRDAEINPANMDDYMKGFQWGAPPHAGAGIGLERMLMLMFKLGNIRLASLFYRDPKSFPAQPHALVLRHPKSSTLNPPWTSDGIPKSQDGHEHKLQPLEELIANYGDATSTSWYDDRYKIWRDAVTGAAVAYVPSGNHAVITGDPLCDPSQFTRITSLFLKWLKTEVKLKPIWILCSHEMERVLGEGHGWRTLSCVADERVDPTRNQLATDTEIGKKIRHAEGEEVKIFSIPNDKPIPEDIKAKIDKRCQDWLSNRKGKQIHLSDITPWRDQRHRQYFYAVDKEGTVCALVVLAELSPRYGMQVKYSFDFPGAPNGTIEYITTHAIQTAGKNGVTSLTFGAGATTHLLAGHNMSGAKVKVLQKSYDAIARQFRLTKKTEFRAKLGAVEVPLYIAYPKKGLGTRGIKALMDFLQD
ncbi:Aminoacyl-tRNA synthetase, class II (D/K/N)-like protein [Ascosphaera apis ARSEF 7405]|uniref:Aspartate--tRNA ligase, cytoplasmic n=1 Tax=Ascosphaera apis ARSEF 7405 TaxID=392613 RepID=A0A166N9T0_9EURO|nr:Aminoacyl-tRNA synthetase, class II (D/K/N)-like protein [Ascosphaera apis ARSEF 7405]